MNAAVQVLTPLSIDKAKKYISNKKIVCIPNPIWQAQKTANLSVQKSRYSILHVGRINGSQKRQHLLIEAFARIAEKFPEWDVYLWGPESEKRYVHNLKHLIHSYNLENRIFLKGNYA